MATSGTIPAISHVAVTVTDLSVSEAWYTRVFGVEPILDEDTGPFRHIVYQLGNTLFGLHGFPDLNSKDAFDEREPGPRSRLVRLREPRRAGRMGRPPGRAGRGPRRDQGRGLRFGPVVPRPGQYRP